MLISPEIQIFLQKIGYQSRRLFSDMTNLYLVVISIFIKSDELMLSSGFYICDLLCDLGAT